MMTIQSNDPDGWTECYSDHAHDIETYGECRFCTSTELETVGHVLPDTSRVTGLDPVTAAELVVSTKSAKFVDGVLLDHFTASAIVAVYSAFKTDAARQKLRAMSLEKAASACFRLTR